MFCFVLILLRCCGVLIVGLFSLVSLVWFEVWFDCLHFWVCGFAAVFGDVVCLCLRVVWCY